MTRRTSGVGGDKDLSKGGRKTHQERRAIAFRAFLEILDTADWIRYELRGQMEMFDITLEGLRFLEMLHREGRLTIGEAARRRHCRKQSVAHLVEILRKRGWVEYEVVVAPKSADPGESRRDRRRGWRAGHVRLSAAGEKFVASALPRNMKLVLAFMRALEWREQQALIRTCRKLREGDILRFLREMEYEDVGA
jgi:hypothetical protein